jgi:enoyl-CoA hydratase/carnithine racemase
LIGIPHSYPDRHKTIRSSANGTIVEGGIQMEMDGANDTLQVEWPAEGIVQLVLNRPDVHNALSRQLVAALQTTLNDLRTNGTIRAAIIAGAGDRAFSTGADLRERLHLTPDERTAHTTAIAEAADTIARFPVPVIAAVRGYALAGGAELAIACDLRVASDDATFGFPEAKIGIFPGAGGVVRLPRLVGAGAANDLLFTGRPVQADEALRLGLINQITASDDVLAGAQEVARRIATNGPLAIRALKAALRATDQQGVAEAHRIVAQYRRKLDQSADYAEGLAAFSERRAPRFQGR